jgi:signal transduction histidine kinase/CheY-like chemotaxis protein
MAPSTAALMVLAGLAVFVQVRGESSGARGFTRMVAGMILLVSILSWSLQMLLYGMPLERWFFGLSESRTGIAIRPMAPLTAWVFMAVAVALFLQSPARRARWRGVVGVLSLVVLLVSLVVLLSYASGMPLRYGGASVPMAIQASAAFVLVGVGLLLGGGANAWLVRLFLGESERRHEEGAPQRIGGALLMLFLALAVVILAAGLFYLRHLQTTARAEAHAELETIAVLKAQQISAWYEERVADGAAIHDAKAILDQARAVVGGTASDAAVGEMRVWLEAVQARYHYRSVALMDAFGKTRLVVPATMADSGPEGRAEIGEIANAEEIVVTGLRRGDGDPSVFFSIMVPVKSDSAPDALRGVIRLQVDLTHYLFPVVKKWPTPSPTAETLLVQREGNEVVYLNDLRHRPGTALRFRRSLQEPSLTAAMFLRGEVGAQEGLDYRGMPVVAAARPVPGTSWVVVAKIDQAEIYAPLARQAMAVSGVAVSLLLAALLGVGLLWRQRTATILQNELAERQRAEEALRASETQLRAAKTAAEASSRAKDQFIAALSHELRTPLSPALILSTAHENNAELPETLREDLATIRRSIELEVRLIDDLLDLSSIVSGKMRLELQDASLHQIVRNAVSTCQADIAGHNLHLHVALAARRDKVHADPARLQQVFWNLLKNAVKFTEPGGTLWVNSGNTADGKVQVEVRDTGVGIAAEFIGRIFNAFEQGDARKSKQFGGLGMGLAIAKAVVDRHGGDIRAQSPGVGKGATFTVELPLAEVGAKPQPSAGPPVAIPHRNARLLLVEDHADTARLLAQLLRRRGHSVETAGSVGQAYGLLAAHGFDLLVSDLGLPDGSGHDVMRRARADRGMPGVCISGYGTEADIERSLDAGFAVHLTKPVSCEALDLTIQEVLAATGSP